MTEITVLKANINDSEKIAQLFDAYRIFYKQESDLTLAQNFIKARLEAKESTIYYARNEADQPLGFTQLYPCFSSVSAQRIWILNDLYVAKDFRGMGIGTLLLNKAQEFAISNGSKGIQLETSASNIGAQKLYESLGYKKNTEISYFLSV